MSKSRLLPVVSALSLGIGGLLGTRLERYRGRTDTRPSVSNDSEDEIPRYFLPLPTVCASAAPISSVPAIKPEQSPVVKPSGSNISQIMKHGFPSMDNIRSFDDFVLAYDKRNRTAHWVFEHLTREKVKRVEGIDRTSSHFLPDESIHEYFRATNDDYKKSGYDRGHLAAAGNHRWSQQAMDQTFHLSNISPQVKLIPLFWGRFQLQRENPDRDPKTQIAHTIIYSRNVFSTVMAGACAQTAALVMTYFCS